MNKPTITSSVFTHWAALAVVLLAITTFSPESLAATKYASPQGSANASGNQRSDAWNASSCFTKLNAGDTCIYLDGNYGLTDFAPTNDGTASNRIVHRCESRHGCRFDNLNFHNLQYVTVINIASDSDYYDSSKSFTNPRMTIYNSHHLKFDSIFVRGEPEACAPGNPGPDCKSGSEYNRYNDLVRIGKARSSDGTAWAIEITGASEFINGNHSVMQFHDDDDASYCEPTESNIWIHGTAQTPIIFRSKYHHLVSFKGSCRILIEYADFGPAGTGRGDLPQPNNATTEQAGGIIHGSTMQNVLVRYSNFANGGSGTSESRNNSHIEIGMFGENVNGACFPHNSHFRPWGPLANIGRVNDVSFVRNASILNNAVQSGWYLRSVNSSRADSPYAGYLLSRTGAPDKVAVDLDGLVADTASAESGLLYALGGSKHDFLSNPIQIDGLSLGSLIRHSGNLFQNPTNWDFTPIPGSPLIGNAVPIAHAQSSGSGTTIPVDRPECFAGTLGGMRSGDEIDINGKSCRVTSTNLANGTISCAQPLSWSSGDEIFYKVDGVVARDIGSRTTQTASASPNNEASAPKPPELILQQ